MKRRFTAAAALLVAVGVAGCSSPPPALGSHDARVLINGTATNAQSVTCFQNGRNWTIETMAKEPGFTAVLQLGDTVTPQSVEIRNLGNFTGTFWDNNLGKAQARVSQGKFSVSGEAQGAFSDNPNKTATASFDITTDC